MWEIDALSCSEYIFLCFVNKDELFIIIIY